MAEWPYMASEQRLHFGGAPAIALLFARKESMRLGRLAQLGDGKRHFKWRKYRRAGVRSNLR